MSTDETKTKYLERLGPSLGPLYHALMLDWAGLRIKWDQYRELFGTSEERVNILNSAAGLFAEVIQDALWEDVLLHLCRITDRVKVCDKSNLTILALDRCPNPELEATRIKLVNEATKATDFARDWRNRRIAHRDLAHALTPGAKPLRPASRRHVEVALAAIHKVLNEVSERRLNSTLADKVLTQRTGAVELLHVIQDGLKARATREDRTRRGEPLPEDLDVREL